LAALAAFLQIDIFPPLDKAGRSGWLIVAFSKKV
jgi:hypothetical protein